MHTFHPMLRTLVASLLFAAPALADGCGCQNDSRWTDRDAAAAQGTAVAVLGVLGVAAITSPLWVNTEDNRPYLEADASSVLGGRFSPSDQHPLLADGEAVSGWGGALACGVSRLPDSTEGAMGVRGEVVGWHNTFDIRKPQPLGPQNFDASVLALGAHVDGRLPSLPVVLSLGGRLGGAYLNSPNGDEHAWAWDVEAVAGVGVELNRHLMLVGDVRGVLLLPGRNDFTSGNGHAVLADVGLRYTF